MVEVKSADTNPSKLPEIEPIQSGKIDTITTRCFDLFCVGKYEQGNDLKLDIQSADKIPNLITKDADGNPIFCEPKPMCTIRGLKGHNIWINIELKTITTNATNYMCLGIKKQGEDDYYDILHTGNMSRYVDVLESDVVELVPLISSTELPTYTAVKAGETAKIIEDTDTYDFGSVYRAHISLHKGQWLADQKCDLNSICVNGWYNYGKMGTGQVTGQNGEIYKNQLIAINGDGTFSHSSNGIRWIKNGKLRDNNWFTSPTYENGIWCTISDTYGVKRSIDSSKSWYSTVATIGTHCLNFTAGVFMTVSDDGIVYTSPDAEIWTKIGNIKLSSGYPRTLVYGDKWICGSTSGYTYWSKDGKGQWEQLSDSLYKMSENDGAHNWWWSGGCYVNGYYYVIRSNGLIARSTDGREWTKVFRFIGNFYFNITYYENKLWAFIDVGTKYAIGLFNPDGTIESLE